MRINGFKIGYGLIVLVLLLLSIQYGVQVASGGHAWKTADWLIHYNAGIVRRGLMGSLFLFLANMFSLKVQWVSYIFQVGFLGILAFFILRAFYRFHSTPIAVYWLWSPAFIFLFWVNHTSTSFRKEILLYISLVFILKAFVGAAYLRFWYWGAVALYIVAGLSHELVIFFLPFFIFPIIDYGYRQAWSWKKIFLYGQPFLLSTVFIFTFALYFSATKDQTVQICESLASFQLRDHFCDGAIAWLQHDAFYGYQKVLDLGWGVWINYFFLLILSFIPILLLKRDPLLNRLMGCAICCALPLFLVAIDYGRWISILYTSLFLTIIWLRPALIEKGLNVKPVWIFSYCFLWVLPNGGALFPYKGVLSRLFLLPFGL